MERVDGEPLGAVIARGPLAVDLAVDYALQMASALAAAHRAGIVHRDLKPGNVMMTRDGRLKIVDFGLSKLLPSEAPPDAATVTDPRVVTETGIVTGTPGYMSPEQASGDPVDARSDVYSFGVVLYEMLAGRRAFDGDSRRAVMYAAITQNPAPLGRVRPDVPRGLQQVVERCLEKDPALRFASCDGVHDALTGLRAASSSPAWSGGRRIGRAALMALLLVAVVPAVPLYRAYSARVRAAALQDVERAIDEGRYAAAYVRVHDLARSAPDDDTVQRAVQRVSYPNDIATDPPGATVSFKDYADPGAPWHTLGVTPLAGVRPPVGALHWRVTREGYEPVESHFWWTGDRRITLHRRGDRPTGMVHVAAGTPPALGVATGISLPEFWIDATEVTNAEFKKFVDAGGYQDERWWKHPIARNGRVLSFTEAMRAFVDRTGRPGPSTWEAGTYPNGRASYPVAGVSWFEAAAFAEFSGKGLPTVHQWLQASGQPNVRRDVSVTNFGAAPLPVSSLRDLGAFGTYGLAGNVKEWCWNAVDGQRYLLGGSWNEPPYMATTADARPPLDRAETHGIRLVKHLAPPAAATLAEIRILEPHPAPGPPVSDEVFAAYRRFYAYERTPLEAVVEGGQDTELWREERISIPIVLLLPKSAKPPYQVVIWCPGSYSLEFPESERMVLSYYFDFVARSGRAVVMPDFQGMWARRHSTPARAQAPQRDAFRQRVTESAKDLGRTIDYLETRTDVDAASVVFYAFSVGGDLLAVPGVEDRLKGVILLSAGLPRRPFPPEVDPVHIAPRMRMPVLLLGGRHDYLLPVAVAQKPLFDLFGAPPAAKRRVVFESGHVPERIAVIREILGWLDETLRPVRVN
jgi:dienelactone hydrolase